MIFKLVDMENVILKWANSFYTMYTAAQNQNHMKSFHTRYTYQHLVENVLGIAKIVEEVYSNWSIYTFYFLQEVYFL